MRYFAPTGAEIMHPLPGARNEGRVVAALFPNSLFVAGPEAKKAMLVDQLPKYNILHFATHGYLDAKEGMRSGLVLAHEKSSSEEETVLEAKEIASLPLSAEMAVLSACHTGQGQASSGEGVLGLAWAFLRPEFRVWSPANGQSMMPQQGIGW